MVKDNAKTVELIRGSCVLCWMIGTVFLVVGFAIKDVATGTFGLGVVFSGAFMYWVTQI